MYQSLVGLVCLPAFAWVLWLPNKSDFHSDFKFESQTRWHVPMPSVPKPNDVEQWLIAMNGVILVSSSLSFMMGIAYSSAVAANVGASLTIPIAYVYDIYFNGNPLALGLPFMGSICIVIGFVMLSVVHSPSSLLGLVTASNDCEMCDKLEKPLDVNGNMIVSIPSINLTALWLQNSQTQTPLSPIGRAVTSNMK